MVSLNTVVLPWHIICLTSLVDECLKRDWKTTKRSCFLIFCFRHPTLLLWWVFLFHFVSQQEIFQLTYITDVPCWRSGFVLPGTPAVLLRGSCFTTAMPSLFSIYYNNSATVVLETVYGQLQCLVSSLLLNCLPTPIVFSDCWNWGRFSPVLPVSLQSVTQLLSWRFRQAQFCSWLEQVFTSAGWQSFYWTLACVHTGCISVLFTCKDALPVLLWDILIFFWKNGIFCWVFQIVFKLLYMWFFINQLTT